MTISIPALRVIWLHKLGFGKEESGRRIIISIIIIYRMNIRPLEPAEVR